MSLVEMRILYFSDVKPNKKYASPAVTPHEYSHINPKKKEEKGKKITQARARDSGSRSSHGRHRRRLRDYVIFFAAASIDRRRGRTQQHQHNQIIQMGDKAVRCEMSVNTAYTTFKLEVSLRSIGKRAERSNVSQKLLASREGLTRENPRDRKTSVKKGHSLISCFH
jgi:hypothetical protein